MMIFYTFRFPLPIFPCVICHTFQNTDEQVFRNDFIVFLLWISCLSLLGLTNASNCDFSCHHDHHPAPTELPVVIKKRNGCILYIHCVIFMNFSSQIH